MNIEDNLNKISLEGLPLHFIGIGGMGMNPLAHISLALGARVTGSDQSTANNNFFELIEKGANIWSPHAKSKLKNLKNKPELTVCSTAITETNEELQYIKNDKRQIIHRSDLLEIIANHAQRQIVITGTHGKTTTTSLLVHILKYAGLEPSWLIGGKTQNLPAGHWSGNNNIFIYEGDESDQSFLKTNPYYSIITSIEPDHLENYNNSFDVQIDKFKEFAQKSKHCLVCSDSEIIQKHLLTDNSLSLKQYSEKELANYNIELSGLDGTHNKLNALACIKLAQDLGVNIETSLEALKTFGGVSRRFERIKTNCDITLIDDYAHHPTEIISTIKAGRELLDKQKSSGRLIVIFQPHLPTRLRDLWNEFLHAFNEADIVYICDLYIARGVPIPEINSQKLVEQINHKDLTYCEGNPYNVIDILKNKIKLDDLILILGAGDITNIREPLARVLHLVV